MRVSDGGSAAGRVTVSEPVEAGGEPRRGMSLSEPRLSAGVGGVRAIGDASAALSDATGCTEEAEMACCGVKERACGDSESREAWGEGAEDDACRCRSSDATESLASRACTASASAQKHTQLARLRHARCATHTRAQETHLGRQTVGAC